MVLIVSDIVVSGVLVKKNIRLSAIIRQLNDKVSDLCKECGFHFISDDKITREFLCDDGIHLNDEGTNVLAGNFVDFIKDFIFYVKNANWHENVYSEESDMVGNNSKQKNDCHESVAKLTSPKNSPHDINQLIEIKKSHLN